MKFLRRILLGLLAVFLMTCVILFSLTFLAPRNAGRATDLAEARTGFSTLLIPNRIEADGPPDRPPAGVFRLVRYPSPAGNLAAYLTPPPRSSGARLPAVIWLKGGWGGIGSPLWDEESGQSPLAFRDAGFVLMCPSFRGENDNPGRIEGFYGEVDDVLAAYDYLEKQPYVDPRRIYVVGYSTGGTLALLTAMASGRPRAVFSFGGKLDTRGYFRIKGIIGELPFNWLNNTEIRLRNPMEFVSSIKAPLFYFEGEEYADEEVFSRMRQLAERSGKPFDGYIVRGADHWNYLPLATAWLAESLRHDKGERFAQFVPVTELQYLFNSAMKR